MSGRGQQAYPLAPANGQPRSDEEAANDKELKKKKTIKYATYIAAFVVFQTGVILIFALTVMKIKTPKFRLGTVTVQNMQTVTNTTSPSFDISFMAQFTVKNTNFGSYKFDASNVTFLYDGVTVGQLTVPKSKAKIKSTKKLDMDVQVNSNALTNTAITNLGSELGSNVLTLKSRGTLSGKVTLMMIMKKKKSANMDCTLTFDVAEKKIGTVTCV